MIGTGGLWADTVRLFKFFDVITCYKKRRVEFIEAVWPQVVVLSPPSPPRAYPKAPMQYLFGVVY